MATPENFGCNRYEGPLHMVVGYNLDSYADSIAAEDSGALYKAEGVADLDSFGRGIEFAGEVLGHMPLHWYKVRSLKEALEALCAAIDANRENWKVPDRTQYSDKEMMVIPLQYISEELEEAETALKLNK